MSDHINFIQYNYGYKQAYFEHEVRQILRAQRRKVLGGIPVPMTLIVLASLVPSQGGQWLLLNVEYRQVSKAGILEKVRHDGLVCTPLDATNGEIVEAPPNGRASAASIERYPSVLSDFLADLTHEGVHIDQLCLGQALTGEVGTVKKVLAAEPGYEHIQVYASASTHAAQVAVPGGRARAERQFHAEQGLSKRTPMTLPWE